MSQKIINILLALFVFLIPSNLFLQLVPESAYVHGLQIDYLIPKLALTELVVLALVVSLLWQAREHLSADVLKAVKKWLSTPGGVALAILLALFVTRQFFTRHPLASLDTLFDLSMLVLLVILGSYSRTKGSIQAFVTSMWFWWSLQATLVFQSLLAVYQFWTQRSLVGYTLLGEGNIQAISKVSRLDWFGQELVAPMGTTAHANVLGGVLAVYLVLLAWRWGSSKQVRARFAPGWPTWIQRGALVVSGGVALLALFLTGSVSGWLTLGLGLLAWRIEQLGGFLVQKSRVLLPWLFCLGILVVIGTHLAAQRFPANNSLARREYLNQAALSSVYDHVWLGVGLGQSTAYIEEYSSVREVVRFSQPPHHVGILWLMETGVVGVLILVGLMYGFWKRPLLGTLTKVLFISFCILTLDHYALTLTSGRALLVLLFLGL